MRRTLLTIAILGLARVGYIAWPVYDLLVLTRAIETRDIITVTRRVHFDALRISLAKQLAESYVRRTGVQVSRACAKHRYCCLGRSGCAKAYLSRRTLPTPHGWMARHCRVRWPTARHRGNNHEHDRNHLADF
jgi:hypothetical protein